MQLYDISAQACSITIALVMEIQHPRTEPSICEAIIAYAINK